MTIDPPAGVVRNGFVCLLAAAALATACPRTGMAQVTPERIAVEGRVTDPENPAASFPLLMIVNKTTGRGAFGGAGGTFALSADKTDSLLVSVIGYETRSLCFADSAPCNPCRVTLALRKLQKDLEPVVIFPERDLEKIEEDIRKLGYDETDYRLTGIDAWSSPLTALYQAFSRKEKDRRRAAQLWNDQRRRDLVQELLRYYHRNDLIDLPQERFDDFTDFLRISDAMLKSWSQYEMAVYIKTMYALFRRRM